MATTSKVLSWSSTIASESTFHRGHEVYPGLGVRDASAAWTTRDALRRHIGSKITPASGASLVMRVARESSTQFDQAQVIEPRFSGSGAAVVPKTSGNFDRLALPGIENDAEVFPVAGADKRLATSLESTEHG